MKLKVLGFGKQAVGVVQFDTTKNPFIAAGDEGLVKFWDMDNSNLLTTIDSEGGLLTSPFVRFNKDGMLLAISIHANGIKILANPDGVRLLRTTENCSLDASGVAFASVAKTSAMTTFGTASASGGPSTTGIASPMPPKTLMNSDNRNLVDRPRSGDKAIDKSRMWKVTEISEPSQRRSSRLPDNTSSLMRVTNLVYTNSGHGDLALAANAVHKLCKWLKSDLILVGRQLQEEKVKKLGFTMDQLENPRSACGSVVMKRAQNVAQAVVRTRSTLSAWSCMGARLRLVGNAPTDDFPETSLILEKHADSLTLDNWSIEQATINNVSVCF